MGHKIEDIFPLSTASHPSAIATSDFKSALNLMREYSHSYLLVNQKQPIACEGEVAK